MKSWGAAVAAVAASAVILLWFPPERYAFYPRCPIYEAFGLLCPGCGATRAAAALLRGHLVEAWHWNGLFMVAVFTLAGYAVQQRLGRSTWIKPRHWMMGLGMATMVFGVIRNVRL